MKPARALFILAALAASCLHPAPRREIPQMKFLNPPVQPDAVMSALELTLKENGYVFQEPPFDEFGRFATHPKITKGLLPDSGEERLHITGQVMAVGRAVHVMMTADGSYRAKESDSFAHWPEARRSQLDEIRDRLVQEARAKVNAGKKEEQ